MFCTYTGNSWVVWNIVLGTICIVAGSLLTVPAKPACHNICYGAASNNGARVSNLTKAHPFFRIFSGEEFNVSHSVMLLVRKDLG
jgi:hypothetical protein